MLQLPFDELRCATFLAEQEQLRGSDGVLYVHGEEWVYLKIVDHEWEDVISDPCVRKSLLEQLRHIFQECGSDKYVIVVRNSLKMDIITYSKHALFEKLT